MNRLLHRSNRNGGYGDDPDEATKLYGVELRRAKEQLRVELAAAERLNQSGAAFDAMRHVRDLARLYARTTP